MTQVTMDNVYRLWEYTSQMTWEGVRVALQNEEVWDQFGDEEAEEITRALDEIEGEDLEFPEDAKGLYTALNQYIGE